MMESRNCHTRSRSYVRLLGNASVLSLGSAIMFAPSALANNECGPLVSGAVVCAADPANYPDGIVYLAPAIDITLEDGVVIETSTSSGIIVTSPGDVSIVPANGATAIIRTTGDGNYGARLVTSSGDVTFGIQNVSTAGDNAVGILVETLTSGGVDIVSGGFIATQGAQSQGVQVDATGGDASVTLTDVITAGADSTAIEVDVSGGDVLVSIQGDVFAGGAGSVGVEGSTDGAHTLSITSAGDISSTGVGVDATSVGGSITLDLIDVLVGDDVSAVIANSQGGNVHVGSTGLITTSDASTVAVSGIKVTTTTGDVSVNVNDVRSMGHNGNGISLSTDTGAINLAVSGNIEAVDTAIHLISNGDTTTHIVEGAQTSARLGFIGGSANDALYVLGDLTGTVLAANTGDGNDVVSLLNNGAISGNVSLGNGEDTFIAMNSNFETVSGGAGFDHFVVSGSLGVLDGSGSVGTRIQTFEDIEVRNGGRIMLSGQHAGYNFLTVQAGGLLGLSGSIEADEFTTIDGGVLLAFDGAQIIGNLNSGGDIDMGVGGLDTLTIDGNFLMINSASLTMDVIGGVGADHIIVTGNVLLDGALILRQQGFSNSNITLIDGSSASGSFSSITGLGGLLNGALVQQTVFVSGPDGDVILSTAVQDHQQIGLSLNAVNTAAALVKYAQAPLTTPPPLIPLATPFPVPSPTPVSTPTPTPVPMPGPVVAAVTLTTSAPGANVAPFPVPPLNPIPHPNAVPMGTPSATPSATPTPVPTVTQGPELIHFATALGGLSAVELQSAINEVHPEIIDAALKTVSFSQRNYMSSLLDRRAINEADRVQKYASLAPMYYVSPNDTGALVWASVEHSALEQDGDATHVDFDAKGTDLAFGVSEIGDGPLKWGVSLGYSMYNSEDDGAGEDEADIDTYRVGVDLHRSINPKGDGLNMQLDAAGSYARSDVELTQRVVVVSAGLDYSDTSDADMQSFNAAARLAIMGRDSKKWAVEPFALATLEKSKLDSLIFSEGTGTSLQIDSSDHVRGALGLGAQTFLEFGGKVDLGLRATVLHNFGDTENKVISEFVQAGGTIQPFALKGRSVDWQGILEATLGYQFENGFVLGLGGTAEFGDLHGGTFSLHLQKLF